MDYSTLCRCCLEEFSQESPMCSSKMIMEMYIFCIQLNYKVVQGEDGPKHFCLKCRDRIKSIYLFIRRAKRCNEKLQKTILQKRAMKNTGLDNDNTNIEDWKSDIEINTDLYDNIENSSLQDEDIKPVIEDDQRLKVELEIQENLNHCSGTPINSIKEVKEIDKTQFIKIMQKIDKSTSNNTDNIQITVPLGMQHSKRWIVAIKPVKTNDRNKTSLQNGNVTTEGDCDMFVCSICDKRLNSKRSLDRHIDSHTEYRSLACNHCEKSFKSEESLLNHKALHIRDQSEERVFICDVCERQFSKRAFLIDHLATHSDVRPFKCDLCQKTFKLRKSLGMHKRLHRIKQSGEKPYACDVCSKRFNSRGSLHVHAGIHSEHRPRPFTCDLCQKSFMMKQALAKHINTHNDSYPVLCNVCGKRFRNESYLAAHMLRHTGVKSYACSECSYRAAYVSSLRRHEATHTNKRQHQCPHCQKMFNGRAGLVRHIRIHTGEKPIQCPSCPLRFIDHSKRKTHLMRVHKVPFNEIPRLAADGQPIPD